MLDQSPISLSAHTLALEVTLVVAATLLYLTSLSAVTVRIKRMFCVHFNLRNFHFLEYKIGIYDRAIIPLLFCRIFQFLFLGKCAIKNISSSCHLFIFDK